MSTPASPPRILELAGAPHPRAQVQAVDPAHGILIFRWLDAAGQPVDSGGSVARFAPAQALPPDPEDPPGAAAVYPEIADATLVEAIVNPCPGQAPAIVLTPLQILARLTPAEEAALATSTELAVVVVRNRLIAATEVRSDDPRTGEGRAILVAHGILSEERAAAIFS